MRDLLEIRNEIDEVDQQILALYVKRLGLSMDVADYKRATGKPVFDPVREKEKLNVLSESQDDEFLKKSTKELFSQIMSLSRKKQYQMITDRTDDVNFSFDEVEKISAKGKKVVFQGVEGAYSQAAMFEFFSDLEEYSNVTTWREAMEAISSKEADYAVLPIENSTAGVIFENYDLLSEYDVAIVGEQVLSISHCLLGTMDATIDDITDVYSHPQALMQCNGFLRSHESIDSHEMINTAAAAKLVGEENNIHHAAICSPVNAKLYGLKVLKEGICDLTNNETRFIVVTSKKEYCKDARKISICFELPNESGSLYQALSHFIFNGLNMTSICSRPLRGHTWEYRFFADFEGNLSEEGTLNALRGLSEEASSLRILGNY